MPNSDDPFLRPDATRARPRPGAGRRTFVDPVRPRAAAPVATDSERIPAAARALLEAGEPAALTQWQQAAGTQRSALLEAGALGEATEPLRVAVPNRPGVVAELALALGGAGINISDLALTPAADYTRGEVALWVAPGDVARAGAAWTVSSYSNPSKRAGPPAAHHLVADPIARYMNDVVIRGTPERVLDKIAELRETIGLEYLMCAPLSHQTFTLFTERVLPKLL